MLQPQSQVNGLSFRGLALLVLVGAAAFHLSFLRPELAFLILVYLGCLFELTRASTSRVAFRAGFALGLLVFIPKLTFFCTLFQSAAVALWAILAFWHGLFVCLGRFARCRVAWRWGVLFIPALWTGIEYFRSELYYLKFSWLSAGYAFSLSPPFFLPALGLYGAAFVILLAVGFISGLKGRLRLFASVSLVATVAGMSLLPVRAPTLSGRTVEVAGVQLEFPVELEVPSKLDALIQRHPGAQLIVLSEYTFDGPVPKVISKWCLKNARYVVVGAKESVSRDQFYNTAYVIGPDGQVAFKQAKAVPIQFFKDGLPAPDQRVWESPWGKIGICICYDLSYSRVVDGLIRQGAQALVVPTMDVVGWGLAQHELHYRVAPLRAAEYRIPIFRLASSGISQFVNAQGAVKASAPFPGPEASLAGRMEMSASPSLPLDRWLAPVCAAFSCFFLVWSLVQGFSAARARPPGLSKSPCDPVTNVYSDASSEITKT